MDSPLLETVCVIIEGVMPPPLAPQFAVLFARLRRSPLCSSPDPSWEIGTGMLLAKFIMGDPPNHNHCWWWGPHSYGRFPTEGHGWSPGSTTVAKEANCCVPLGVCPACYQGLGLGAASHYARKELYCQTIVPGYFGTSSDRASLPFSGLNRKW